MESNVVNNSVLIEGNYTTGIAARTGVLDATGNHIALISSEQGNESIWEGFGVAARGILVISGNATIADNTIATPGIGVLVKGNQTNVDLENNFINVVGNVDKDAYAIYAADAGELKVLNNNIDYQGNTNGTGVNNAILISGTDNAIVANNNFTLDLASVTVDWIEVPAGSGNFVSNPVSEGIVVKDSSDVTVSGNSVNVTYGNVVGSYDTIYAVDVSGSGAVIAGNDIVANGNSYIYGIILSGDDFVIRANNISASGTYYANGIDIEGPASGVVEDNIVDVKSPVTAYAIYSGMNGNEVKANYTGNNITGNSYNIFGFSLGDVESNIDSNEIILVGNYTTGIAYRGNAITVTNNTILALGSNVGNESIWEAFGVESISVKVVKGNAKIANNSIVTTGDYPVDVQDNVAVVNDNYLVGKKFAGDGGVKNDANSNVYNNTPKIENKTLSIISITEVDGNCNVSGVIVDGKGIPIAKEILSYSINGVNGTVEADENGTFKITGISNGKLFISYDGDSYVASSNASITLKDIAPARLATQVNVTNGFVFTCYAVDYSAGERGLPFTVLLTDSTGKPLANTTVFFGINGNLHNKTTDENGVAYLPINLATANTYTCAVIYAGDETHNATFGVASLKVIKKTTSITASAKSYKVSTKTKSFTVTLKTIKGSSADGKTYLKSGKKVTLKVNGKTYTGKTNANGKVTFKITNLNKKGKFSATISFAGDKTYASTSKKVTLTAK